MDRFTRLERTLDTVARQALGITIVVASVVVASCSKPVQQRPPAEVTVAPALGKLVSDWDEFTGHFESVDAVDVRPRVSGFIDRVAFTEGAIVRRGDPLFYIDARPYQSEDDHAQSQLEQARTRAALAQGEHERAERLVATQAISREELDARSSSKAEADAAVRAAQAALETAKLNLEWTVVRAPISGRVSRAAVTAGNVVQAGAPSPTLLTTIVSLDPIYVYFDSDEQAYLKYVNTMRGRSAELPVYIGLTNETGFPHKGKLDFVDNRLDAGAGTIRVRAVIPNPSQLFVPGLFARVRLVGTQQHAVTLIQDQAIGTDQDRKFVLVLKPDSSVDYRPVTIGRLVDGLRVVSSGLAPGEDVVVNGLLRVRPGMKVLAKHTAMADSATLAMSFRTTAPNGAGGEESPADR
jgi:RND family efflux transporter MFP subunit